MISIDCETTGVDVYHKARPFFVTSCDDQGYISYWQWDVDPLTREPVIPDVHVSEIQELIDSADTIIGQNIKFDVGMLLSIGIKDWPWHKTHDTLIAGHLLASNKPHDLTSMVLQYIGEDIEPLEELLHEEVEHARRVARSKLKDWRITKKNDEDSPSAKDKTWRFDYWLPKAICKWAQTQSWTPPTKEQMGRKKKIVEPWWLPCAKKDHPWNTTLQDYANKDSESTILLWKVMERLLRERDLWEIYLERMKLVPIAHQMECQGVTISLCRLDELQTQAREEAVNNTLKCESLARSLGVDIEIGKTGNTQSVRDFVFDTMRLPVISKTDTGNPALDKHVLASYEAQLDHDGIPYHFINSLSKLRARQKAIEAMEGYRKFAVSTKDNDLKIISGGQNGVDQAALRAAKESGLSTGGTIPKGWRTLDGSKPFLGETYGLVEGPDPTYPTRTSMNVRDSDATIILYENLNSPGEKCTKNAIHAHNKPCMLVNLLSPISPRKVSDFICANRLKTVNIAGNSERTCRGIGERAYEYLLSVFDLLVNPDWAILHASMNITGTDTLRWSSKNPSVMNVGKDADFSMRYPFGPAPGREWWALDYENIELRIPSYESGEEAMIELFEKSDEPPYFGSQHLLYFDVLHPEKFKQHGKKVKDVFKSTWYQWTKNGDFAIQYGAMKDTADKAYHVDGAYDLLKSRFKKLDALNQKYIRMAERYGYVETLPDKTVNPRRGYPLLCTRTDYGKILPTVPLNYHTQSSAMWCTAKSMVRCSEYLSQLNSRDPRGYYMALQVHDEIVFDFPQGGKLNLPKVRHIKSLMEMAGDDIGIPLKVSITYHPSAWSKGEDL